MCCVAGTFSLDSDWGKMEYMMGFAACSGRNDGSLGDKFGLRLIGNALGAYSG